MSSGKPKVGMRPVQIVITKIYFGNLLNPDLDVIFAPILISLP